MSDISAASTQSVLDSLMINKNKTATASDSTTGGSGVAALSGSKLGKETFLKLMVAQLKNQNPLNPQDNGAFVAQLAQFSSVEGIENLNSKITSLNDDIANSLKVQNSTLTGINAINGGISSINNGLSSSYLSNQALQASSLVGRAVTVKADQTEFQQGQIVNGSVTLPDNAASVNLYVYDAASQKMVDSIPLGKLAKGDNVFRWNGQQLELNGNVVNFNSQQSGMAPTGNYKFVAQADINGAVQGLPMALSANVNSVTVGANGQLVLNLSGLGAVPLSAIKQLG